MGRTRSVRKRRYRFDNRAIQGLDAQPPPSPVDLASAEKWEEPTHPEHSVTMADLVRGRLVG